MRKLTFIMASSLLALFSAHAALAQVYFPQGTKWTELRLDTTQYDSWYTETEQDGEKVFVPNYHRMDFVVGEETPTPRYEEFDECRVVRCSTNGGQDSVCYYVGQKDSMVYVVMRNEELQTHEALYPWEFYPRVYDFKWRVGKTLFWRTCFDERITGNFKPKAYGTISEIKEATFGGEKPLEYVDFENGIRIIRGIGVTMWNNFECLFGPAEVCRDYLECLVEFEPQYFPDLWGVYANYRSILVHFERDGEVLYDLWPNEKGELVQSVPMPPQERTSDTSLYDLQGRRLTTTPPKGIYIRGGKKYIRK